MILPPQLPSEDIISPTWAMSFNSSDPHTVLINLIKRIENVYNILILKVREVKFSLYMCSILEYGYTEIKLRCYRCENSCIFDVARRCGCSLTFARTISLIIRPLLHESISSAGVLIQDFKSENISIAFDNSIMDCCDIDAIRPLFDLCFSINSDLQREGILSLAQMLQNTTLTNDEIIDDIIGVLYYAFRSDYNEILFASMFLLANLHKQIRGQDKQNMLEIINSKDMNIILKLRLSHILHKIQ